MLTTAIADRNKEALSAAVSLATQLRLRSPQVREYYYCVLFILRRVLCSLETQHFFFSKLRQSLFVEQFTSEGGIQKYVVGRLVQIRLRVIENISIFLFRQILFFVLFFFDIFLGIWSFLIFLLFKSQDYIGNSLACVAVISQIAKFRGASMRSLQTKENHFVLNIFFDLSSIHILFLLHEYANLNGGEKEEISEIEHG